MMSIVACDLKSIASYCVNSTASCLHTRPKVILWLAKGITIELEVGMACLNYCCLGGVCRLDARFETFKLHLLNSDLDTMTDLLTDGFFRRCIEIQCSINA